MAKSDSPLSKRVLSAWTPPPKDPYLWDSDLGGFGVRFNANGTITALLGYYNKRRDRKRHTLGKLSDTYTINQARKDASTLLADIRRGFDPEEEKQNAQNAIKVRDLIDAYLASAKFESKAESTQGMDRSRIKRHILPLLGKRYIDELTPDKIRRFHQDICAGKTAVTEKTKARGKARVTGGESVGRSCVKQLSAIFNWAMVEGIAKENPCKGVEVGSTGAREAILETPEQYKSLFEALDRMQYSNIDPDNPGDVRAIPDAAANAIRVLAFTGARRDEITQARWSWVDLSAGTLTLPPKAHKTGHQSGKPKVIALPSAARAVIAALPKGEPDDFVFPATRGDTGITLSSKLWGHIRQEASLPPGITNHSLRHSLGTLMAVQGAEAAQIAAALGHSQLSTTQRYIHIARDARAEMAEKYTAGIAAAIDSKAEVVPLQQVKK